MWCTRMCPLPSVTLWAAVGSGGRAPIRRTPSLRSWLTSRGLLTFGFFVSTLTQTGGGEQRTPDGEERWDAQPQHESHRNNARELVSSQRKRDAGRLCDAHAEPAHSPWPALLSTKRSVVKTERRRWQRCERRAHAQTSRLKASEPCATVCMHTVQLRRSTGPAARGPA